ncbi:hypothetical protein BH160DRAFT_5275 [Burkholderia sp. H160]|nr:hypothetical protein BH160DRAFT_5275 [Burkholderia sp. H160]
MPSSDGLSLAASLQYCFRRLWARAIAQSVEKQSHQPAGVWWVGTFKRGAQGAHRAQELVRLDTFTNLARSYRSVKETLNDRAEPLEEINRQSLEGGIA